MEQSLIEHVSNYLLTVRKSARINRNVDFIPEDIACIHPQLIVNPSVMTIVTMCNWIYIDSNPRFITPQMRHALFSGDPAAQVLGIPFAHVPERSKFPDERIWKQVETRFLDYVSGSFFLNKETGETYPLYIFVPCGKCDACQSRKYYSLVQRCQLAFEESQLPMIFCTLTYNNSHYPKDNKPCLRDIQLFKKRFKRHVDKFFFNMLPVTEENVVNPPDPPSRNVKFCIVSERGKEGRIHYHCAIFGCPQFTSLKAQNRYYTMKLVQYCWRDAVHKDDGFGFQSFRDYVKKYPRALKLPADYDPYSRGFINFKLTSDNKNSDNSDESQIVSYILKYVAKDQFSEDSSCDCCEDGILSISTNMGLQFVRERLKYLTDPSTDGLLRYVSFSSGKVKTLHLSSYYIKKLFPSISELIPVEFRRDFASMMYMKDLFIQSGQFTKRQCAAFIKTCMFVQRRFEFWEVLDTFSEKQRIINAPTIKTVCEQKQQFMIDFGVVVGRLLKYEINYDAVLAQLRMNMEFFSKFKKSSADKVGQSAHDFRKNIIVQRSKSYLP